CARSVATDYAMDYW
nr:immunoglobulin heavy chain junction region [Mus musculus]MBK4185877.1 immunoglobulin heavy chain junction region [Mus musculus]MBK4185878.1 immunoglobulin heavy chain junction region [Mus musculus]